MGYLSFYYWLIRILYSWYKNFIRHMICQSSIPFCRLSFHFLDGVFWNAKYFNLMKSKLSIFILSLCLFLNAQICSIDLYVYLYASTYYSFLVFLLKCKLIFPFLKRFSLFIYLFVAMCRLSLVVASGGYSLVAVYRLLILLASLVAEHRL